MQMWLHKCHRFSNITRLNTDLIIHKNSKIGILSIKTFSDNTTFLPLRVDNVHFESMKSAFQNHNNSMIRLDLSTQICNMLKESSPMFRQDQKIEAEGQETLQSKQILITTLVRQAGVDINLLKLNKNGAIKMDFHKMQNNLNQILLGQYVMKSGLQLSKSDLREIQTSDPTFFKIISNMETCNLNILNKYELVEETLYKTTEVYGQKVYRLCLPNFLGQEVLQKLHFLNEIHLTPDNLLRMFNTNFYTAGAGKIVKTILQKCILCRLNKNRYKKSTSGQFREHQNDLTVGSQWQTDICHMPRSKSGFKYLLVFSERISSYICAMALKNITSGTVANALRIFLGIIPFYERVHKTWN
jgi:hypothetical protein